VIHLNLKQTTRELHAAVESKLRVLLRDDLSAEQYAAVQKKMYGFYRPIESKLSSVRGWDDPEVDLRSRLKLPLIADDLSTLAIGPEELEMLPLCDSVPPLETVAEALGCLYVLEGSTLGGRIISGHLRRVLPADSGCSFFRSYGDGVGRMWSSFLGVLARHSERHGDDDAVVASACQTFTSIDRWLSNAA
jgi:heme oxygenase